MAASERMLDGLVRAGPPLTLGLLTLPLVFGLAGTVLPSFGYLPALGGNQPSLAHFNALASQPGLPTSVLLALATGLATTVVSLLVVMSFIAGFAGGRTFGFVQHALSPLLAIPHAAAAFALAFLIAPSGYLIRLLAPLLGIDRPPDLLIVHDPMGLAMMAGLVIKEIPFLFLVTLAALPQVDLARSSAVAASFGYGRVAGFLFLVWPALYRQIRLAVYAVVAFASSVVDVAMILGPTNPGTLATRLLQWMSDPDLSMRFLASAGAVLQLATTAVALSCWFLLEKAGSRSLVALRERGVRFVRDAALRRAALASAFISAGAMFAGIALLAVWSVAGLWQFPALAPETLTLRSWETSLPRAANPLVTTLAIGAISTLMAVLLTLACLEREHRTGRTGGQRAMLVIYLPLIVPQISFVFGLQLLFLSSGWSQRHAALVLVHLVFVLPYVFLSLSGAWRAHDRRYDMLAASLGRSRTATLLTIRLPMLARAILTAMAVGFAVSVGQYLPTVLIGEGRIATVTTEAVALASGGNRRVIGVYALLQTILPFLGFALAALVPAVMFRQRRGLRV